MKKILTVLVVLAMALSMLGMTAVAEEETKYGILAPAMTHGWVGGVAYFAQQAAEDLSLDYTMLTCADSEEMSSNIEKMVQLGVSAIVVWPQFPGVEGAAEMALEAGVKIINFDQVIAVDEKYADGMYVLTGDNYGMGVKGAEYIVSKNSGLACLPLYYAGATEAEDAPVEEQYAICVTKGNTELLDAINAVLADLIKDGKVEEMVMNHLIAD